jgi:heme exporter protein A
MAHIKAHRLGVSLKGRSIFENLHFEINPGQGLVLHGPNGAGKSVLLQVLAGLITPTDGVLSMNSELKNIKILPHLSRMDDFLNVSQMLNFWGRKAGVSAEIECWGLSSLLKTKIARLSDGQYRRVMLATMFSHDSDLLLLDEPSLALDEEYMEVLSRRLDLELEAKKMMAISSHEREFCLKHNMISLAMGGQI